MLGISQAKVCGHGHWLYSRTGRFCIYDLRSISFERDIRRHSSGLVIDEHGYEAGMEVFGSQKPIKSSIRHTLRTPQPISVTSDAGLN